MAARAGGGDGWIGVDWTLRIDGGIQPKRQICFAPVHVAHGTVASISGRARGAHGRIADISEIVMASSKSNHCVSASERGQVIAGVDPMYQKIEIHTLGRLSLIGRIHGAAANRRVCVRRIVAQDAVLRLITQAAVDRGELNMASLTISRRNNLTARRDRRSVSGKVDHLIDGPILDRLLGSGSRQHRLAAPRFHTDGVSPCRA